MGLFENETDRVDHGLAKASTSELFSVREYTRKSSIMPRYCPITIEPGEHEHNVLLLRQLPRTNDIGDAEELKVVNATEPTRVPLMKRLMPDVGEKVWATCVHMFTGMIMVELTL